MYYNQLFEANKDSVYNLWKTLNLIINPQKCKGHSQITKLMYDGKLITDKQNISDAMNMHFCDIGRKLQSQLENCTLNFKDFMAAKNENSFFLTPISKEDILLEIKNLKQNKTPGHDMIGTKIIKLCPEIFANILEKNYNRALEMGIYPDDIKIAKVIALFKKGKKFDPNNYRPISLLSHFDKFFEKIFCKRLISFLEIYKIYYCHQFGFRKGYSTAMALTEIIDCIKHLLDEKNYVVGIFIDFKKAFDTVDHNILLSKFDHYGIRGHANMFLGLT